jgi:hypothetical protein
MENLDYNFEAPILGNTLKIIHCESAFGTFEFVFKKKIKKQTIIPGDTVLVASANGALTKNYIEPIIVSEHDLYAMILTHDHGGILEKVKFQDFGTELYTPDFVLEHCIISDEDKNGLPEFYLSYMSDSDGLDAKPFKQIIYTYDKLPKSNFIKSKATAYFPAGNEGDEYQVIYDDNWKKLPAAIKIKSSKILEIFKKSYQE